jgi:hypothetical protein
MIYIVFTIAAILFWWTIRDPRLTAQRMWNCETGEYEGYWIYTHYRKRRYWTGRSYECGSLRTLPKFIELREEMSLPDDVLSLIRERREFEMKHFHSKAV